MSNSLISHSLDLKRLRDEGYEIEVKGSYLVVTNIPYLNHSGDLKKGTLVSELTLSGDITTTPNDHTIFFNGEYPYDNNGNEIQMRIDSKVVNLSRDLQVNQKWSRKPTRPKVGYVDYYEKITTYIMVISNYAKMLYPEANAKTFSIVNTDDEDQVHEYLDTASSRADIMVINKKLEGLKIGVIGLGGTGSYILDLISKTHVKEIHLFDGDVLLQHNAFRSPGAVDKEDLRRKMLKVEYFKERYSRLHKGIITHGHFLNESNVDELIGLDFVFIAVDKNNHKKVIIGKLNELKINFIDSGMGISKVDDGLIGILRVTTNTQDKNDHITNRIPLSENDMDDDYSKNIQIAELNAFNALMAVIKWKKLYGYYHDHSNEHHTTYSININMLNNEDSS